ncbi:MAG TPA: nuclear transport factor 2 family protein [Ktedonobacterales bacterium]|jgi:ketosteroid isomerase-like protein|nr:nuclear transport factor 2 family protein [Ktedonobacterales bacterium]
MSDQENRQTVEHLWHAFDAFDFEAAGQLLSDDFVCEWPQSRERIRGRENFVAVNANYPGRWHTRIERIIACGDMVVTDVALSSGDTTARAVSFFELRGGKIVKETAYWPEPYAAPASRAQWVEPMA